MLVNRSQCVCRSDFQSFWYFSAVKLLAVDQLDHKSYLSTAWENGTVQTYIYLNFCLKHSKLWQTCITERLKVLLSLLHES